MDPATFAELLNLSEPPMLKSAKVTRHHPTIWGPVPTLVDDRTIQTVHDVVYQVQSRKEEELLCAYAACR